MEISLPKLYKTYNKIRKKEGKCRGNLVYISVWPVQIAVNRWKTLPAFPNRSTPWIVTWQKKTKQLVCSTVTRRRWLRLVHAFQLQLPDTGSSGNALKFPEFLLEDEGVCGVSGMSGSYCTLARGYPLLQ